MDRYQYVRNHIKAYEYEYKMLTKGEMQVEQLPAEAIQGILYQMLQQLMDSEISIEKFENHIEFLDEMLEDYHFDDYLGASNKKGTINNPNPLISIISTLDQAEEEMNEYKNSIEKTVKSLFQRLFMEEKYALEFFGNAERLEKSFDLWKKDQFMDVLVNNMIIEFDEEIEVDRIQQIIDDIDTYEDVDVTKFKIVDDNELPFN